MADDPTIIEEAELIGAEPRLWGALNSGPRKALLDERIRELIATVGDGRLAYDSSDDADDQTEDGMDEEYEAGSDAWVSEQVRLTLALSPANYELDEAGEGSS